MINYNTSEPSAKRARGTVGLTQRQTQVLRLIAQGKANAEIATELGMSENTVRIHVSAILKALGVANRTQAALVANQMIGGNGHALSSSLGNGHASA
jgi:DNA-binding NarL/FixJ family response regulator